LKSSKSESTLKSSLAWLVDLLPCGVVLVSLPDERIVFHNAAVAELLHLPKEDSGPHWGLLKTILDEAVKSEIYEYNHKNQTRWIRVSKTPFVPPHPTEFEVTECEGAASDQYVVYLVHDETWAMAERAKFKALSNDLELAQSIAKIGSWTFDLTTKEQRWSKQHYEIFEIPYPQHPEVLFSMYRSRIHPEDIARLDVILGGVLESSADFIYDHRVICPSGKVKNVRGYGRVIRNDSGVPVRIFGTCQDVTEAVSKETERKFLMNALGIGIWKFNPVSGDLEWDESMYDLFDVPKEMFSSHYDAWESTLTPEAKENAVKELQSALKGEKEFNTIFEIMTKRYGRRHIAGKGQVMRNEKGDAIFMYGINYDVTGEVEAIRQLEAERVKSLRNAKLASLGEMSAGVAHEINNPLTIIYGALRSLPKYVNDPVKFQERMAMIEKAGDRMGKIVRSLKKFARQQTAKEYKKLSIGGVMEEVFIFSTPRSKQHDVPISLEMKGDGSIFCDETEIEQVFINLIGNSIDAVKTLNEKWVKVIVSQVAEELVIHVIDSGRGISPAIVHKMFEPFFTTKPVGEGTGLGLSIVKGILDEHKATIEVLQNVPNTTFEVRFKIVSDQLKTAKK
jgi:signal transduction histidine kinase